MTKERFLELTATIEWASIDELKGTLDRAGYWEDAFVQCALDGHKKTYIRRMIRQLRDDEGNPTFASIVVTDASGRKKRVYKQERLFDIDDYQQAAAYHFDRSRYHFQMGAGYVRRAREKLGVQLPLPFDIREAVAA